MFHSLDYDYFTILSLNAIAVFNVFLVDGIDPKVAKIC